MPTHTRYADRRTYMHKFKYVYYVHKNTTLPATPDETSDDPLQESTEQENWEEGLRACCQFLLPTGVGHSPKRKRANASSGKMTTHGVGVGSVALESTAVK